METLYAQAERDGKDEVRASFAALRSQMAYDTVLDLIPSISFIVNDKRQVLFANIPALSSMGLKPQDVVGARPGELFGCVHAHEMPGGCGTSEGCRVCGAVNAILESLSSGRKTAKECRISAEHEGRHTNLDVLVTAMPISSERGRFVMVTMDDISSSKRREVLEHLFFHDVMNSLASIQAGVSLLSDEFGADEGKNAFLTHLSSATDNLIDEVQQQRELLTMEKGKLGVEKSQLSLLTLVGELVAQVEVAAYATGKHIAIEDGGHPETVLTDPIILRRILSNMLKNALEASDSDETVTILLGREGARARISVHNPAIMPREVQLQVFQRSFSTKGRGRGIGTYSMKLLTEDYLGGEIGFSSSEAEGTSFRVLLPAGIKEST